MATPLTARSIGRFLSSPPGAAIVLVFVAVAVRAFTFGNPVVHIDEQFYRLVGGRMLHGALLYVDIFDRKPIGLFLIYAAARVPGGDGVIGYQLLALACAWGTAFLLYLMGRRIASAGGGVAAGVLYLLALDLAGGEGGQAPVFYNLLVAGAAAIGLAQTGAADPQRLRRGGAAAMLLVGLAMQVKYNAVFEGLFFGLVLLARAIRLRRPPAALALDVALWIGCALAPTALAAAGYAVLGHFHEWLFANVTSIAQRGSEAPAAIAGRINVMALLVAPLMLTVPLRRWLGARATDPAQREALRFTDGWAASALLGVVLFGTWFNHYALPLFAPLALAAAPLWARRSGRAVLVLLMAIGLVQGQRALIRHGVTRGDGRVLAGMVRAAGRFRGCAFVYDGMPAFYDATGSCLPTTRPFPAHLQARNETGATGIDQATEVRRIMAARPERVMSMDPAYPEENLAARAEIAPVLARDYVTLYRYEGRDHHFALYGLRGTVDVRKGGAVAGTAPTSSSSPDQRE